MATPTTIADGIELEKARNRLPGALACIVCHLLALWFGCELFGAKRFINATWLVGAPMLALYAVSAYSAHATIKETTLSACSTQEQGMS